MNRSRYFNSKKYQRARKQLAKDAKILSGALKSDKKKGHVGNGGYSEYPTDWKEWKRALCFFIIVMSVALIIFSIPFLKREWHFYDVSSDFVYSKSDLDKDYQSISSKSMIDFMQQFIDEHDDSCFMIYNQKELKIDLEHSLESITSAKPYFFWNTPLYYKSILPAGSKDDYLQIKLETDDTSIYHYGVIFFMKTNDDQLRRVLGKKRIYVYGKYSLTLPEAIKDHVLPIPSSNWVKIETDYSKTGKDAYKYDLGLFYVEDAQILVHQ